MGMMDKLLDAMRLNPDEDFDDDELDDDDYDFYDDDEDDYDMPSGPSEREIRRQQAAEEKAAKREAKRRDKEESAAARSSDRAERSERAERSDRAERSSGEVSRSSSRRAGDEYVYNRKNSEQPSGRSSSKITPISGGRSGSSRSGAGMVVRIIKPTSVDDEVQIVDTLLDGRTVIINMEGFDLSIAQRIIDFTIGATYAMSGDLQRISNYIFLATPPGVDISGDISNIKEQYDEEE